MILAFGEKTKYFVLMTERVLPPEPEIFAARAVQKLKDEGRTWAWLARTVGMGVGTLKSQLVDNPGTRLKLRTARRVASALGMSVMEDVVAPQPQPEAVAS